MNVLPEIAAIADDMTAWRHDFHAHPELGYEESRTSAVVAEKLRSWGIETHTGLGKTGVVGVIDGARGGGPMIGLRADMDALPMQEENDFAHRSTTDGVFHGCGHDGHTTMLLGAARYLSERPDFAGRAVLIFQPAEEGLAGAKAMIDDGLFARFPCDEVYGMHNWPSEELGQVVVRKGPIMAASDFVDIEIEGVGGHAAMPHRVVDPIVVASHVVTALQTLTSRALDPLDSAVVSITRISAGSTYNVIPPSATLAGTVRSFTPEARDALEAGIAHIATHVAEGLGAKARVQYRRNYPPTVNSAPETERAAAAAAQVVGAENVHDDRDPCMGGEDFAFMLEAKPGSYLWLGQGGGPNGCHVHNPRYDFNDAALPVGASIYVKLLQAR